MINVLIVILLLVVYILLVGFSIWIWKDVFLDFDWMLLGLAILLTILVLLPVGYIYDDVQKSKAVTEITTVEVEVTNKQYSPPRTNMIMSGKVLVPVHVSAKYEITVTDDDYTKVINNKQIYDEFEIGDIFKMNKIIYKNKSGEAFDRDFKFIE